MIHSATMGRRMMRIRFQLDSDEWHGRPSETVWGESLAVAHSPDIYRLRNSPFFMRSVSFLDVVRAVPAVEAAMVDFAGVIDRSGHSTFAVMRPPRSPSWEALWIELAKLGCTYESKSIRTSDGPRVLYAVDVPPDAAFGDVRSILQRGQSTGAWIFQEGHIAPDPDGGQPGRAALLH